MPNGVLIEYDYDSASRVTKITYKKGATVLGDLTYAYDKAGDRTQVGGTFARTGIPPALSSATFNVANRQTNHTYDDNGNLLFDGTNTYTWNARNQLASMTGPSVGATFVYDGLGRREKKTVNSNLTEFLYDGVNPVQETSGAAVLANILPGLGIDEFLTRTDVSSGITSNLLTDALGSTIALTDSAGTVQTENTYEPFGKTTTSGAATTNPFQYTGRENDGTDLYYYRARYYHPQLQRFLSEDPIQLGGDDINFYVYAANNPVIFRDPTGLFSIQGNCCGKEEEIRKSVQNACDRLGATITDPSLRKCIKKRCDNAKIECEQCGNPDLLGYNYGFFNFRSSKVHICANNNPSPLTFGQVAIHEWAHSCGWNHGGGKGVPE